MAEFSRPKRVTLHDVAHVAGVSHTTVSLVIQNHPRITKETREKVQSAIDELGYRPNSLARQLAGGKNNTLAVLAAFFSSHFELEFMRGLQMAMGMTSYNLSQFSTRGSEELKEDLFDQILQENRADGIIALNLKPSAQALEKYRQAGVPVVLVEEDMENAIIIKTDNFRGAWEATRHLIERGYRHIALLSGAMNTEEPGSSPVERFNGYLTALKEASIPFNPAYVYETEDYEIEDGMRLVQKMLAEHPDIDAVFCPAGDLVAFGILRYAKAHKIAIPQRLAVLGYDDHSVSEIVSPALSTMRQPIYTMGSTALTVLVQAIKTFPHTPHMRTVYSPQLIVREST